MIKGKLEAFFETGTEGVIWSIYEDGKQGYDGLHPLNNGDYLTIFHSSKPYTIVWEGTVDLEYETNYRPYPTNPEYGQQAVLGRWVHGVQRDVVPEDWAMWFMGKYKAECIKSSFSEINLRRCKGSTIFGYSWSGDFELENTGDLILKFKGNKFYRYKDVDYNTYIGFEEAESKGKYFANYIKNAFVTEQIELPSRVKYNESLYTLNSAAWPFPTRLKP